MIKIMVLLFLSPPFLFCYQDLNNLKLEIEKAVGLEKVKVINTLVEEYLSINVDSALFYAKKSFELAKLTQSDSLSAASSYLVGRSFILKEDFESALEYTDYSMVIFSENKYSENYLLSLFDMGIICHRRSEYDKALEYYTIILTVSKEIDDRQWIATALDGIGTMHYLIGNCELALSYLDSSLTEYKRLNIEDNKARLLYGIGAVHMTTADYDQALDFLFASIKIAEEKEEIEYLAYNYHAIGVIYQELKNFSKAIEYSDMALNIAKEINHKYLIGNFLSHLGEVYLQLSKIDTAMNMANKALLIQTEINNRVGMARAYDLLGDINQKINQYQIAFDNYEKAWEVIKNIDQKYRQTKIIHHLGVINKTIGKYDIAKRYLYKSLDMSRNISAQDLIQDNLSALSDYYVIQQDYKKAYQYLVEFTQLSDSIFTTNSHNIAAMQMRYETGKREKENELLKSEIDIQTLELEKSILKNWLSTLSLVIVSIIGFFSYHRYNVKRKANVVLEKKIQDALQKHQEQQEIIFHQANLSSLGELSAGMAHEINQPLQGIKLSAEALDLEIKDICSENSSIKENISEVYQGVERIKKIIDHMRIFASQQKSHIDEYFKTSTVIENALSLLGKQYLKLGVIVQTKLNGRIGLVKGNPYKYEQVVFNLLSNAKDALLEKEYKMKESFNKEILLKTFRDDTDIVLEVRDNGIGMTSEQKDNIFNPFFTTKNLGDGTGLGLSIVFGIVKEMDGKILVESDFSVGTSIQVRIPRALKKHNKT